MRTWERAKVDERCGGCNRRQEVGAPVLAIEIPHVGPTGRRRIRGVCCAEEPVDEAQLAETDAAAGFRRAPASVLEFSGVTRDLFDPKMAAANDGGDE